MHSFTMSAAPLLRFGEHSVESIHQLMSACGWRSALLVISRSALARSEVRHVLLDSLASAGVSYRLYRYDRLPDDADPFADTDGQYSEATPSVVDGIVKRELTEFADEPADVVAAIGGGSAIDTGKAVSAALKHPGSIRDYLEGVGTREATGAKVPFVAVPTTAGTGSEATKNAVLSEIGRDGFKKSLRHDRYVPDVAIIDPLLQTGCPSGVAAASGMDAIAQLLEAYVSTGSNPLTDALALDGLAIAGRSFARVVRNGESDADARAGMAYAAYLSGRCLANAGLGIVHGLAGPAGAHSAVPHGVFCAVLLGPAIDMLSERLGKDPDNASTLQKLAIAGRVLAGRETSSTEAGVAMLRDRLSEFTRIGTFPGLRSYGFNRELVDFVASEGNSKSCPIQFEESERVELLNRGL